MQSFRTELENNIVEKDIIELEAKINAFHNGEIDGEKFRSLRLARGVYGQRQEGVQMIRIKLPFGKITANQLRRIADVSDEYSRGRLHTTTRQDIQIHHVSLDRTPELWAALEKDAITLREACGNTVRNITASPFSGIDKNEAFDVSGYAQALFEYFLRYPVNQDLGRKVKIAFSNAENDTGLTFMHDLGFIAKTKSVNGEIIKGFKVLIGGGLGAQPFPAQVAHEFLPTDQIVPFTESVLRAFDRLGERNKRHKARLKYLLKSLGLEAFLLEAQKEQITLPFKSYEIPYQTIQAPSSKKTIFDATLQENENYKQWYSSNVFSQKQNGYHAVAIQLQNGDFYTPQARALADLVDQVAIDDVRITPDQNLLLKFIQGENLPYVFEQLSKLGLASSGYNTTFDITACPGTDTCNLGISNSTGTSRSIEKFLRKNYPDFIKNTDLKIKISGCMNACGQHTIAPIGFHGSSIKKGELVFPALQVLLGGGVAGDGVGHIADKVIKIPSKKVLDALELLLEDYNAKHLNEENFTAYYQRKGKIYFYDLLKPIAQIDTITQDLLIDWGNQSKYERAVGVGECAGVVIDLVSTLLLEVEEKIENAKSALADKKYADAIYFSYSAFINGAKTVLTSKEIASNSHQSVVSTFEEEIAIPSNLPSLANFSKKVFKIHTQEPSENFAKEYLKEANLFFDTIQSELVTSETIA